MFRALEGLGQDVRYGLRQLRRSPGFTAVALLTLALGIGANTALFSLLDAALLKRLPVPHSEQLLSVIVTTPAGGWRSNVPSVLFDELRKAPRSFSGVFAFWQQNTTIRWSGESERALVQHVSGDYYGTLDVRPFLGRLIARADDRPDGGDAAVLGYDFWVRRFAADPAVLGKTLLVDGTSRTIVGVTPRWFFGTDRSASPDVTVPLGDPLKLANVWVAGRRPGHPDAHRPRRGDRRRAGARVDARTREPVVRHLPARSLDRRGRRARVGGTAAVASDMPARRAAHLDPNVVLHRD
jgi:hypothetical protein